MKEKKRDIDTKKVILFAPIQKSIWKACKFSENGAAYNEFACFIIKDEIEITKLRAAVWEICKKNELLQCVVLEQEGEPFWELRTITMNQLPVQFFDFENYDQDYVQSKVKEYIFQEYDICSEFLFRVGVFKIEKAKMIIAISMHHLISDGWTMRTFQNTLFQNYYNIPINYKITTSYLDYCIEQEEIKSAAKTDKTVEFWRKYLQNSTCAVFPCEKKMDKKSIGSQEPYSFSISNIILDTIFSDFKSLTPYVKFLSLFSLFIYKYTGEGDFVIGAPVSIRDDSKYENTMGCFLNVLPIRIDIQKCCSFLEIIEVVQNSFYECMSNKDMPFENIHEKISKKEKHSVNYFDIMISMQNIAIITQDTYGDKVEKYEIGKLYAKYKMIFNLNMNDNLDISIDYDRNYYSAMELEKIIKSFMCLCNKLAIDPQMSIQDLNLLTTEEYKREVIDFNDTTYCFPEGSMPISELIVEEIRRSSDRIALIQGEEKITYIELGAKMNTISIFLQKKYGKENDSVALIMKRSINMVIAILGIVNAGKAYIPIEPDWPKERKISILNECNSICLLVDNAEEGYNVPTHKIEDIMLYEDTLKKEKIINNNSHVYTIFTSGSSGKAKGVKISNLSLVNRILWMKKTFSVTNEDVFLFKTPYTFDVSVWEVFLPLVSGATLVVSDPIKYKDSKYLLDIINLNQISFVHFVPSMLEIFLEESNIINCESLRFVISSGEALNELLVNRFYSLCNATLVNLYGPTEACIDVSYYITKKNEKVYIGKPISNVQLYVLDGDLCPVPEGVVGELYIGGICLADGYCNNLKESAVSFMPNPFVEKYGERMYKTGDLVKYKATGNLEFVGRNDTQIKLHGYRIELKEVEQSVLSIEGIQDCVILPYNVAKSDILVCIYRAENSKIDSELINRELKKKIPYYMCPNRYISVKHIPLSTNGKIDFHKLKEICEEFDTYGEYIAPKSELEKVVVSIIEDVLHIKMISLSDNLFGMGADSIKILKIVTKLRKKGYDIELEKIYNSSSVREICDICELEQESLRQKDDDVYFIQEKLRQDNKNIEEAYPLTALQFDMLFFNSLYVESSVYHDVFSYRIKLNFDKEVFKKAWLLLSKEHSSLRKGFEIVKYSEPIQVVYKTIDLPYEYQDISNYGNSEKDNIIKRFIEEEKNKGFYDSKLFYRIYVFKLKTNEIIFLFSFHHAILDGWSVATLFTELFNVYYQILEGIKVQCVKEKINFKQYVEMERQVMSNEMEWNFWKTELENCISTPIFGKTKGTALKKIQTGKIISPIDSELFKKIKKITKESGTPLKTILFAAFLQVVKLVSGENDFLTGYVMNGRIDAEGGDTILGVFLNTIPFRYKKGNETTWIDLLKAVFSKEKEYILHRRFPYAEMQKRSKQTIELTTVFDYTRFDVYNEMKKEDRKFEILGAEIFEQTNVPLYVQVMENEINNVSLILYYDKQLFKENEIDRFEKYYMKALRSISLDLFSKINLDDFFEKDELKIINREIHYSLSDNFETIQTMFQKIVRENGEKIAIVDNEMGNYTYEELNNLVNCFCETLSKKSSDSIIKGKKIGIYLTRSIYSIISVLASIKCGMVYVPLDPEYPEERIKYIIDDSNLDLVVMRSTNQMNEEDYSGDRILIDKYYHKWMNKKNSFNPDCSLSMNDPFYLIYTSGTTGKPKGVMGTQCGFINRHLWQAKEFPYNEYESLSFITSINFVDSVCEMLSPLISGNRLVIFDEKTVKDPVLFVHAIYVNNINRIVLVPSLLSVMLEYLDIKKIELKSLKIVVSSGEKLVSSVVNKFYTLLPQCKLVNYYGSSETAGDVTFYETEKGVKYDNIPLGNPIYNTKILVLNEERKIVPCNTIGEIYVIGLNLANGYNIQEYSNSFVENPYAKCQADMIMYKTGDRGYWDENGLLFYTGRKDAQIKMNGFRIELGEIESVILSNFKVQHVVVKEFKIDEYSKQLVAFIKPFKNEVITKEEILERLNKLLNQQMIPNEIVFIDNFPLMPNGKVDISQLNFSVKHVKEDYTLQTAATTELEKELIELCGTIINNKKLISINTNLIEQGFDSISIMRLSSKINEKYGIYVSVLDIYDNMNVLDLSKFIEKKLLGEIQSEELTDLLKYL